MKQNYKIENITQRESLKNQMIGKREKGEFDKSVEGFKRILEWDQLNENIKGAIDVFGHLRIALTNQIDNFSDIDLNEKLIKQAEQFQSDAGELIKKYFPQDKGKLAIADAHLADLMIIKMKTAKLSDINSFAEETIKTIKSSLRNLGGSKAHKAWVYNKMAQAYFFAGQIENALDAINNGEMALFNGYEEEMKNTDGLMKIKIWQTGLWLTRAAIYSKENRKDLAVLWAEAVINLPDPSQTLNTRKLQAKKIINNLI